MELTWCNGVLDASCPVCGEAGPTARLVDAAIGSAADGAAVRASFLRCAVCATVFAAGDFDPDYGEVTQADPIVQYYVEHLAAIDTVIDPLFKIDRTRVRRYAEIGCSFGFSLDFAREIFGWEVRGIEPGPLGRAGAVMLELPLEHRLFSQAEPLGGDQADLLVATEVVEHIRDPHAFMRGVVASLAPAGILVMSTPNALAITPEAGTGHLGQILCPGYHLVIFTPDSLARLVRAHGFVHCECRTTPTGLVIYASREPFQYSPDRWTDRADYTRYLERRLDSAQAGGSLERGMAYRLIREHAMFGQWDRAIAFMPRLFDIFRAGCAVDLRDPASADVDSTVLDMDAFARRHPFNLSGVFYALGMVDLLHRQDDRRAVAYFDASTRWAKALDDILRPHGIADAEAWIFRREAEVNAAHAEIRYDPVAAMARLERLESAGGDDAAEAPALARAKRAAFVELVNRGDFPHARRVAAVVAGGLCLAPPGSLDPEDECRGCYAVGIYTLLHLREPALARHWLTRAVLIMEAAPERAALRDFGDAARRALVHTDPPAPAPALPRGQSVMARAGAGWSVGRWPLYQRLRSHWPLRPGGRAR